MFPFTSLLIHVLRFYRCRPEKCMPILFCVADHDINYMYNCCNNLSSSYYIKAHRGQLRQILCLPDHNKNSQEEFLEVTRNCLLRRSHARPPWRNQFCRSKGLLHILFLYFFSNTVFSTNSPFADFLCVDSWNIKPKLNLVEVQNLNWIFRFEVYARSNGHFVPQESIAKQRVLRDIFVSLIAHNRR